MSALTRFLHSRPVHLVTAILLVQAAAFHLVNRREEVTEAAPLRQIPEEFAGWELVEDRPLDSYNLEIVHPDDYVMRMYARSSGGRWADLFIAYFRTQRTGHSPHSPRNCLPGRGWVPSRAGYISISVPGDPALLTVNRYVVAKESARSVVLYWYQTARRVIASEYEAKIWLVLDAMRYNRSDTALVRVVVPVGADGDSAAERSAVEFAQAVVPLLRTRMPLATPEPLPGTG